MATKLQSQIRQVGRGEHVDFYYWEDDRTMHYQGTIERTWRGGHEFLLNGMRFHTVDSGITWRHWNGGES